jgi:hypothetical protein
MLKPVLISIVALGAFSGIAGTAQAQQLPNLAGTYRCEPEPSPCRNGQTFTVSQSGAKLDFKNEKGEAGEATVTSAVSASAGPPWNMLGSISSDAHLIQWSDGTQWRKQ